VLCLGPPRCHGQAGEGQEGDAGAGGGRKGDVCPVPTGGAHTGEVLPRCPSTIVAMWSRASASLTLIICPCAPD